MFLKFKQWIKLHLDHLDFGNPGENEKKGVKRCLPCDMHILIETTIFSKTFQNSLAGLTGIA